MKPVHILVLVLAGALGGAVLMKVVQRPHPAAAIEETQTAALPSSPQQQPQAAPVTAESKVPDSPAAAPVTPAASPVLEAQQTPSTLPATPAASPAARAQETPATVQPRTAAREKPAAPMEKKAISTPKRHSPPPANPRPLVVAKLDHPSQPVASAPAQETAPPPSPAAPASAPPAQEIPTPQPPAAPPPVENVTPPAPPEPVPHSVTLNAGLLIPVRLVDGLSSERNSPGDLFLATIDRELVVDGFVIAERGARVEGRVVATDRGTRVNGDATLSVELIRLHTSDRQVVPIETDAFEKHMQASRRQDVAKVGAGAAIGAVIGAIAGGGKGAAIGAGVGGGAGAGDVLLTRPPATLPSETRIDFRLRTPVKLTEKID